MDNVTREKLESKFPGQGAELFEKIRHIGGFGDVDPNHEGGLDIKGLPEGKQKQIDELFVKADTDAEKIAAEKAAAEKAAAEKEAAEKKAADAAAKNAADKSKKEGNK